MKEYVDGSGCARQDLPVHGCAGPSCIFHLCDTVPVRARARWTKLQELIILSGIKGVVTTSTGCTAAGPMNKNKT